MNLATNNKTGNPSKILLQGLFNSGPVALVPKFHGFERNFMPRLIGMAISDWKKYQNKKKYMNSFYYLKSKDLLNVEYRGKQMYISLTEAGKKKAKGYTIDDLKIIKPKKWDRRWRIMIFDIKDTQKVKREALRGKIKELGLFQLQKSVWVCPYDFEREVKVLKDFFQFSREEMKTIIATEIEDDEKLKRHFHLG